MHHIQPKKQNPFHLINDFASFGNLLDAGKLFCAFDTETTGLKSDADRIIEIGAVLFDKSGVRGTFGTLVNPRAHIPHGASAVNHITDGMVQDAPGAETAVPAFAEFAAGAILVAHNAQFDLRFMNAERARLSLPPLPNRAIDTLRYTRWAYPDAGHWTLQALAERLGIRVESAHRAQDDARVCMEIFVQTARSQAVLERTRRTRQRKLAEAALL